MDLAIKVFANGIAGVFLGMAALYLAMKIVALVCDRFSGPEKT